VLLAALIRLLLSPSRIAQNRLLKCWQPANSCGSKIVSNANDNHSEKNYEALAHALRKVFPAAD